MCGISGAVEIGGEDALGPLVARIVHSQRPRGPDASDVQVHVNEAVRVTLGHNRLSIIDLAETANQPMSAADGRARLSFNGEIYNFVELRQLLEERGSSFRTRSDSEVLLQAYLHWGEAAFERLYGMFAFALHDIERQRLYLVRDRFGVKPLYYWRNTRNLVFASTPQEIARWKGLQPNLEYVRRGLAYKYYEDDSEISPFEGLSAIPPGHFLKVDLRNGLKSEICQYYSLTQRGECQSEILRGLGEDDCLDRLCGLLQDACKIRLRADVPIGISVSGGLDSSTIAAVAAEIQSEPLQAITFGDVATPETEGPLVERLGASLRMPVDYVWPTASEAVQSLFWRTLAAQGAPFAHTSVMAQYAVFERARELGLKVMFGGQGGDEAFMGYRKFFLFQFQDVLRNRRLPSLPNLLANMIAVAPAVAGRAKVFWDERSRYRATGDGMPVGLQLPPSVSKPPVLTRTQSPADRQRLDVTTFSLPTLLRYEDRNSMGNSVESRLPLLDHRLVEFGIALPIAMKLKLGRGKHLLRRAVKGRVPERIRLSRDKRGFDTCQERWLREGLGDAIREALLARRSDIAPFLLPGTKVESLFALDRLIRDPQAFKEATSLLWLSAPCGDPATA